MVHFPIFNIAFDAGDSSVSKIVAGSKWEEKQQWIEDLKR